MIDKPGPTELLLAVAEALTTEVIASINPSACDAELDRSDAAGAAYTVRIAANLCRIVARQAELGPEAERATTEDLERFLSRSGSLSGLVAALDQALIDNPAIVEGRLAELHALLLANATRRLAIARPEYLQRKP